MYIRYMYVYILYYVLIYGMRICPSNLRYKNFQIRTYYAEYQDVDVIFHTDRFDDDFEFEFEVSWVSPLALPARFGALRHQNQASSLDDDGKRGNLVTGTFCERVFHGCSPRGKPCLVQSPGRPGIYPRNLNCR